MRSIVSYSDKHPEWWVLALSASAWFVMFPHALASNTPCHQTSFWADWYNWLLMVTAMMLPLMQQSVRWTAERSFRFRERRAMSGYLLGYLSPWMILGLGVAWMLGLQWIQSLWRAPLTFALASVWAATGTYARIVRQSHRIIPLAPVGWRADRDCLRFGLVQGLPCVASCAPLMVGCTLTGHGLVAMVGGAALGASERRAFRPRPWMVPLGCAALAAWYGAKALLG
jgi:hypothetical protein